MRGGYRRAGHEEEEESSFISMTDMTVSFLFIIMILLAFFVTNFSSEDNVPRVQFEGMRDQRDAVQREKEALGIELRGAIQERDTARAEIINLKDRIATLEQILLEMRDQRDAVQREKEALDIELRGAIQERNTARAEISDLKDRIATLENTLLEMDVRDPLEAYLTRAAAARLRILEVLRDRIRLNFPDLLIEISAEIDALRFQGEGLFDTGKSALADKPKRVIETIAERLDEILPCYTLGRVSAFESDCNPSVALIEAVQIEGHTDAQGPDLSNLTLSTDRANATFTAMISRRPDLPAHLNFRDQPVLSVAGYGEMRPVATNDTVEGRSTNRRIDLRIIMYSPTANEEIERIRVRLAGPSLEATR